MEVIRCWEEKTESVGAPYARHIRVMLAPDVRNAPEVTFSHAIIDPFSRTDCHQHDRPELIMIVSGRGKSICDGKEIEVEADMALWVRAGEMHQMVNTGPESMKLATVFVPGYTAVQNLSRIRTAVQEANRTQA
jgi:mannose-6-phosphate isomerase-like protein (cupin superfamily)